MAEDLENRGVRKNRTGAVVSKSGNKSIVVLVERKYPHPVYGKVMKSQTKFHAHDEKNEAKVGDKVRIVECRPVSKMKKWRVVEVLGKKDNAV